MFASNVPAQENRMAASSAPEGCLTLWPGQRRHLAWRFHSNQVALEVFHGLLRGASFASTPNSRSDRLTRKDTAGGFFSRAANAALSWPGASESPSPER